VLGAHLGSFAAMRLVAQERSPITVNVLMYTRHAARINSVLQRLTEHSGALGAVRVIPIDLDSLSHVLMARSAVRRGEVVAVLADRLHPSDVQRASAVALLGGRVDLPSGPVLLGAALGCPVVTMFALRSGDARYTIHVDAFAERIALPRADRDEAVRGWCQAYAQRLEHYCRLAPHQWFNFYDYWSQDTSKEGQHDAR
jgi:predicted LPLAT superfamily acyltransferase